MDRNTADGMLRGELTGHPLDEVLFAAKAPATDRELAGEAAATAAFRAAVHHRGARRSPLLQLLSLKVAAAAFATSATVGGVALAASTGTLSGPVFTSPPAGSSRTPAHSPAPAHSPSRSLSPAPSRSPQSKPPGPAKPSISARPQPKLDDLCGEFGGRDRYGRGQALDDDRFGELINRAGKRDRDRVERFCADLREQRQTGNAPPQPSFGSRPGDGGEQRDREGG